MKEHPIIYNSEMVRAILDRRKTMTRRVIKPQPEGRLSPIQQWLPNKAIPEPTDSYYDFQPQKIYKCPYGQVGDRLWVREAFAVRADGVDQILYKVDYNELVKKLDLPEIDIRWKPSIHMFRKDSRILLEVTDIRVERLQEITEKDAIAEGITRYPQKIRAGNIYKALCDFTYEVYPLKWGFSKGDRLRADVPSLGLARFYSLDIKDGQCIHLTPNEAFSMLEDESISYKEAFSGLWDSLNAKRGYGWDKNPWVWVPRFTKASV